MIKMRISTFGLKDVHKYGDLWWRSLELRRQVFVEQMAWDIPCDDDVEFDQYDRPDTSYVICHEDRKIFGAIRVAPMAARWGAYSSMIGDAVAGLLPGIPQDLVSDFDPTPEMYEATRFFVAADRTATRMQAQKMIFEAAMSEMERRGGDTLLSISPVSMIRLITRTRLVSEKIGRTIHYDDVPHAVIATRRARVATVEPFPVRRPAIAQDLAPAQDMEPLKISA